MTLGVCQRTGTKGGHWFQKIVESYVLAVRPISLARNDMHPFAHILELILVQNGSHL